MSSLAAILNAANSGTVQTRQALIVTGLQNDCVSPDGGLPSSIKPGFIDRIRELVPAFREHGNIVWVWNEYSGNRKVNDPSGNGYMGSIPEPGAPKPKSETDPSHEDKVQLGSSQARGPTGRSNSVIESALRRAAELDLETVEESDRREDRSGLPTASGDPGLPLSESPIREACCKAGTWDVEPIPVVRDLIDPKDIHIKKKHDSALQCTSLLLQLRAKLVIELYFAGCDTNLSVYATVADVARHGLKINIIQDCMGCRQMDKHDEAVSNMVTIMGAEVTTAHSVMSRLRSGNMSDDPRTNSKTFDNATEDEEIHDEEVE